MFVRTLDQTDPNSGVLSWYVRTLDQTDPSFGVLSVCWSGTLIYLPLIRARWLYSSGELHSCCPD